MPRTAAPDRVNTPGPEQIIGWTDECARAQRDIDEAAEVLASRKGFKASIFRRVKKAGTNMVAFRENLEKRLLAEDERIALRADVDQYGAWTGVKYYRAGDGADPQGEFLVETLSPEAKDKLQGLQDGRIHSDGYNSRRGGSKIEDNPHEPGSRDHQTWAQAWGDADRDMDAGLSPIGAKASSAKRPAGTTERKALPAPTKPPKKSRRSAAALPN